MLLFNVVYFRWSCEVVTGLSTESGTSKETRKEILSSCLSHSGKIMSQWCIVIGGLETTTLTTWDITTITQKIKLWNCYLCPWLSFVFFKTIQTLGIWHSWLKIKILFCVSWCEGCDM